MSDKVIELRQRQSLSKKSLGRLLFSRRLRDGEPNALRLRPTRDLLSRMRGGERSQRIVGDAGRLLNRLRGGEQARTAMAVLLNLTGQAKAFSQDHFVRKMKNLSEDEKTDLIQDLNGRKTPQLGSASELVVVATKGSRIATFPSHDATWDGKRASNIIETSARRAGKTSDNMHMTVKPVDLIRHLIEIYSPDGGVVLDPFLGSGSHGVAAITAGRNFIGFEMSSEYYAFAHDRIAREGTPIGAMMSNMF